MLSVVSKQKNTVDGWVKSIQGQLSRFLDFENGENKAVSVNNYDWFGSISFIDFSVISGNTSHCQLHDEQGVCEETYRNWISYTEFAYQIMQGYDFFNLTKNTM